MTGYVTGAPKLLLRLEGLLVLVAAVVGFAGLDESWWLFAILFLMPDVSMLGYIAGPKVGAVTYNAAHAYLAPLALLILGAVTPVPYVSAIGLIWAAHVGFDRALGYGLKYADSFGSSHLGRIGRSRSTARDMQ